MAQATYVYAMTQSHAVKIGYSTNPNNRRAEIEFETGTRTALTMTYRCGRYARGLEKQLHRMFRKHRIGKSEWFKTISAFDVLRAVQHIENYGPMPPVIPRHKTAKEHADAIALALPRGEVGNGTTLTIADIREYTGVKANPTLSKTQDELAKRGVIQKRSKRPALVAAKYRPAEVGNEADGYSAVVSALENLGWSKKEARAGADATNGKDEREWIGNAIASMAVQ